MGKSKTSHIDMLQGPIALKLISFAFPVAVSAFLQQMLNAADVAVVGRFASSDALAAVGANTFIINLMLNLFVGLSVGANVVIARYIGQKRHQEIRQAVHTSVLLSLISGVFLSIVGWFIAPVALGWLSTPANILDLSVTYFRIYFLGMPFLLLFNFTSAILRSNGDTRRPLYIMAASGVVNVILNLILVILFHLSVAGVAIATLVASVLSSLSMVWLLRREEGYLHLSLRQPRIHRGVFLKIAAVGVPAGVQGVIFNISNVLIQSGVNSLGTAAMAANTASLNFDYFCFFIGNAFGQAGTSFMSQNYGAREYGRCRKVMRDCMLLGPGCTLVFSQLCVLLAAPLSGIFTSDPQVVALSVLRFQVVLTFYGIHSFNEILSGMLRALGHSLTPALINIVFICGIRICWLFFFFPSHRDFGWLMACYPLSWVVNIAVLIPVFFWITSRKLKRV